jgi:hypothetical protein
MPDQRDEVWTSHERRETKAICEWNGFSLGPGIADEQKDV